MEVVTTISAQLDPDLAHRLALFRQRYSINLSEFLRTALVERMDAFERRPDSFHVKQSAE